MRFHYITLWGENDIGRKLNYSPAAMAKMKYMLSVMGDVSDDIRVASFSSASGPFEGIYQPETVVTADGRIRTWYCATFGCSKKWGRMLERAFNIIQLFLYLLFAVRKNDIVIFYHERYFLPVIRVIKKLVRRKFIIEVEEIYTQAAGYTEQRINKEIHGLQAADAYILINDKIASVCGLDIAKPHAVLYGTYAVEDFPVGKFDDGKIHLVYAGTLDRKKGGAWLAVNSAKFLSENYHLHILGFGTPGDVEAIKELVDAANKCRKASVSYDGVLTGVEYLDFIRKCHIGLSAQNPKGAYNDTSFPSKVLSYMSNGLTVVSVRIDVLTRSKIGAKINYYTKNDPQELATTIMKTVIGAPRKVQTDVSELDREFRQDFRQLIKQI